MTNRWEGKKLSLAFNQLPPLTWCQATNNANVMLPCAMHYFVLLQYIRQSVLNANFSREEVTLVTHHLYHGYLASLSRMPILPTSILAGNWPRLLPKALSPASPPSLACHVWLISQSLCILAWKRSVMRSFSWCGDNFLCHQRECSVWSCCQVYSLQQNQTAQIPEPKDRQHMSFSLRMLTGQVKDMSELIE